MEMIRRNGVLLLFALLAVPFLGRALFFDEGSIDLSAKAAAQHPLDPHRFAMDLGVPGESTWPQGGLPVYTHPPLTAWLLGAVQKVCGDHLLPMRAVMLLVALATLWAAGPLAALFTGRSTLAVFFFAFSPAFFLTSLTLYPHLLYTLFYVLALRGCLSVGKGGAIRDASYGIFLALAALSLHQWPVLAALCGAVAVDQCRRDLRLLWRHAGAALLFLLVYGGWCLWETHVYGMPQFAASYLVRAKNAGPYLWMALPLPAAFLAGGATACALAWALIAKQGKPLAAALASTAAAFVVFHSPFGGFTWGQAALLAALLITGLLFLGVAGGGLARGAPMDRRLLCWIAVEFLFLQRYLALPCGHHLLPLALAAAVAAARLLEKTGASCPAPAAATLALWTLILAQADHAQAGIGPRIAAEWPAPDQGRALYWGNDFGPYEHHLKKAGWTAADPRHIPDPGDHVIVFRNAASREPLPAAWRPLFELEKHRLFTQVNPLRTWSRPDAAGWYSASWGALPYAFAAGPSEEFVLLRRKP